MSFYQLPDNFTPGDYDVVIGKGKKYFFHKGNAMLRNIAASMLEEYSRSKTKLDKSLIISDVAEHVRAQGSFVKRDNASDKWVLAEDLLCREKISAVFRDAMHQRCRSSTPSTSGKRALRRAEEQQSRAFDPLPMLQWKNQIPSSFTFESSRPSFLLEKTQSETPFPSLATAAATSPKTDIFSIFSVAMADITEEGDPFEPKPLYEGPASA
ncbi:Nitrilase family, member 2 [Seminavis robusta]|uniref:Nitrilase family, member 2 n=1 Tax=Seminavis robusta TaxID=568900 RepID=A0A9N8D5G4_9STRA|nr:Nitrilase family, member 2 [Seminavis robusta]|eukprot:Sro5_g004230.1 Nitrilase family, member 2 (211) ;mRNA; r:94280-94999